MAYHWMQEVFDPFKARFKAAPEDQKETAGDGFDRYQPAFLHAPYYAEIMGRLLEYSLPTARIGELAWPGDLEGKAR